MPCRVQNSIRLPERSRHRCDVRARSPRLKSQTHRMKMKLMISFQPVSALTPRRRTPKICKAIPYGDNNLRDLLLTYGLAVTKKGWRASYCRRTTIQEDCR